jgi:hypothetical protein
MKVSKLFEDQKNYKIKRIYNNGKQKFELYIQSKLKGVYSTKDEAYKEIKKDQQYILNHLKA